MPGNIAVLFNLEDSIRYAAGQSVQEVSETLWAQFTRQGITLNLVNNSLDVLYPQRIDQWDPSGKRKAYQFDYRNLAPTRPQIQAFNNGRNGGSTHAAIAATERLNEDSYSRLEFLKKFNPNAKVKIRTA